jgi:hypothetical protein
MARRSRNSYDSPASYRSIKPVDVRVTHRTSPNIIGTVFNFFVALIIMAIIVVVLLTGLGAVIVNMDTTGGMPQLIVDISTNLYHTFFK